MTVLKRCKLPQEVRREWGLETSLAKIHLYGREGDIHSQVSRVETMGWKFGATEDTHILQPPATVDQPGWRQVTTKFSLPGTMTTGAEGGILPGARHCLVIPIRMSFVLCVENIKTGRVGAVRIREESLSRGENDCCGPESVVQSLLQKLEVWDWRETWAYIIGTGPNNIPASICSHLLKRNIPHERVKKLVICPEGELGVSNNKGRPEQDWVFVYQHR